MRQFKQWMGAAISLRGCAFLVCGTMLILASCSDVKDNPSQPSPSVEKKMVIATIKKYLNGEFFSCDSFDYDSQGRLVYSLNYGRMGDSYDTANYHFFTYYPDRIEDKDYQLKDDGTYGYYVLKAYYLGDNGYIAYAMSSKRGSGNYDLVDTIYTCQYNSLGQMVEVSDGKGGHSYDWQDGNLVVPLWSCTYSDAPVNGYWPITIDEINNSLYWMGWYGKLSAHLPAKNVLLQNSSGAESEYVYDYQLDGGRIVSYTTTMTANLPTYHYSFETHYQYFFTWKEIVCSKLSA